MTHLVLRLDAEGGPCACGLCRRRTVLPPGVQLCAGDLLEPVCRECGRKHEPSLAALMELARAAERVGKIGRHLVSPPLAALLDLAHAAEAYAATVPQRLQAV